MAKPITIHTAESLRAGAIEVGDCLEWQGYFATGKYVPYVYHDSKMVAVRKLLAILTGRDVSKVAYWGVSCDNWRCINPEHTVGRTRHQHFQTMANQVDHQAAARIAKLQQKARARAVCKLDTNLAEAIRLDGLSSAQSALANGISKSQAAKIKAGTAWKQVTASANPWAGLMGAAR